MEHGVCCRRLVQGDLDRGVCQQVKDALLQGKHDDDRDHSPVGKVAMGIKQQGSNHRCACLSRDIGDDEVKGAAPHVIVAEAAVGRCIGEAEAMRIERSEVNGQGVSIDHMDLRTGPEPRQGQPEWPVATAKVQDSSLVSDQVQGQRLEQVR